MSIRRDGCAVRSQRLLEIQRFIAKQFTASGKCEVSLIVNSCALFMGLTEKRLLEYIGVVCRAKGWVQNEGVIYPDIQQGLR